MLINLVCMSLGLFFLTSVSKEEKVRELNIREREKILNKIISKTARQLSRRYNMRQIGGSGGMPGGIIQYLGASFQKDSASLGEAREIAVNGCLEFIKAINSNEQLRPYLSRYPFNFENIEIGVFFDENIYDTENNTLNSISCFGGNIFYRYKTKGQEYGYSKEIKESFEEALQKVEKKNASVDKK